MVRRRIPVVMMVDALFDGVGGAERFAAALACTLPADRFAVTLCTTRTMTPGRLVSELDEAGVGRLELRRSGTRDVLAFRHLARFLRAQQVEILHCHKFGSNLWGSLVGRLARVPVVIAHEHSWTYAGNPLRRALDGRLIGPLSARFVAVSELDRRRMVEIEGVNPAKALFIPTGYLPRPDDTAPGDLRAELGLPAGTPIVGTLAALRPQKRLQDLVTAFGTVLERVPDAHLVIGGDGPELGRLQSQAAAPAVAGRVHFLGVREDLATLLAAFDVAAMSSTFEGMPLFMFEAMTHGVPLVCTGVGGIPDVLRDGVDGVLVDVGRPDRLAAAIADLLGDPTLSARLAASARERSSTFTIGHVAARFADLYEELLAQRGAR